MATPGDDTEADTGLSIDEHVRVNQMMMFDTEHGTSAGRDGGVTDAAVELLSSSEHNETWITTELVASTPSGIVNVAYTAAAEVISVLE